jgi:hypothetical protein
MTQPDGQTRCRTLRLLGRNVQGSCDGAASSRASHVAHSSIVTLRALPFSLEPVSLRASRIGLDASASWRTAIPITPERMGLVEAFLKAGILTELAAIPFPWAVKI